MPKPETTTRYTWDAPSLIRRIDVRQQSNGQAVAYLYADPDPALHEKRLDIRAAIRLKGWGTLSDHRGGEFSLRVSGLRDAHELISMLQQQGFVDASVQQIELGTISTPPPASLWDRAKANSLQWSGILASVGNSLSISSGIHRSSHASNRIDYGQIGKGLAFAAADLPLAIAGGRDDARQLADFLRHLKSHYEKEGIEIPHTASIYVETSDAGKTFGERTRDIFHRYANQIKCSFEVVAAGMSVWAGKTQRSRFKEISPYFWGSGFLASLLIPERKIDEEKYAQASAPARLWMKIQSNPLSVGGLLGYTNNIGDYLSARAEHREWKAAGSTGPKFYRWDVATPTVMLGANGLYAASKKTVGGDIKNDAIVSDAYTIAAQIINKQPENLREKAMESTARFFGERVEIPEHRAAAIARLRNEIELQRQNPWFEPRGLPAYVPRPRHPRRDGTAALSGQPENTSDRSVPASTIQADGLQHTPDTLAANNPPKAAARG